MTESREVRDMLAAINAVGVICVIVGIGLLVHSTRFAPFSALLISFGLAPIPRWVWRHWHGRRERRVP